MFVACLLLFPVLVYNTETLPAANGEGDYWNPFNNVWDTSIDTNASESFAVENNYSYSVPPGVVDETIIVPTSKSNRMYSGDTTIKPTTDDGDEPTNHTETNDSYSVTTEREFSRNITTIPNSWYNGTAEVSETSTRISYDSYWGKLFQTNRTITPESWYNRTAEIFVTTTAKIPHDRYSGRVGSITLENGILTAHLPETGSAEEIPLTTVAVTSPIRSIDWWSSKYGTTSTTGRPYYNPYYGSYRQNTTTENATTPKRPNDWWSYKYGTTSTTGRPYYNPYYGTYRPISTTTPDSWHNKTAEVFETATTGKPNDWFNRGLRAYFRNITTSNFWYNKTPEHSETTTTARSYNRYWPWGEYSKNTTPTPDYWHEYSTWDTTQERYGTYPRTTTAATRATSTSGAYKYTWYPRRTTDRYTYTWNPTRTTDRYTYTWAPTRTTDRYTYTWYPRTTTDAYEYTWYPTRTTETYQYNTDKATDTTDQANRTPLAAACRSCGPENISNSTINTNDRRNYGKLIDLLKRIAENILPSTNSIAPNSNVTHLTVASGNGNMFIYVNN